MQMGCMEGLHHECYAEQMYLMHACEGMHNTILNMQMTILGKLFQVSSPSVPAFSLESLTASLGQAVRKTMIVAVYLCFFMHISAQTTHLKLQAVYRHQGH